MGLFSFRDQRSSNLAVDVDVDTDVDTAVYLARDLGARSDDDVLNTYSMKQKWQNDNNTFPRGTKTRIVQNSK